MSITASTLLPVALLWLPFASLADSSQADAEAALPPTERSVEVAQERIRRERERIVMSDYFNWFGSLAMGRGVRFNNPYRLERVLGTSSESLSLSAPYLDVAAGVAQGDPSGVQHGLSMHLSVALTGIRQEVLTPSYRLMLRPESAWLWTGRCGIPLVLEPDVTAGFEVGVGSIYRVFAGLGVYAELVGSVFFGAATLDRDRTTVPMLSLQSGVWFSHEVLE